MDPNVSELRFKKLDDGQRTFINELSMREICPHCKNRFNCLVNNIDQCQLNSQYMYARDFYKALSKYVTKNPEADVRRIPAVAVKTSCINIRRTGNHLKRQTKQDGIHLIIHINNDIYTLTDGNLSKR